MRILNVIAQFPGKTGSGTYLDALMKEGTKRGHIHGLVAAGQEGLEYHNKDLAYIEIVKFGTKELPFHIVGMSDIMPYNSTMYSNLNDQMYLMWKSAFEKRIVKAIEEFKPDVILSHHLWLLTGLIAAMEPNVSVHGICHGTDMRQLKCLPHFETEVVENIQKLDSILSLSIEQKEDIKNLYSINDERISIIGGGYDYSVFHFPQNKSLPDTIKLIYAGKLSYAKGLLPFLNVYKRLKKKYNIELWMAGSGTGEEKEKIVDLAKQAGVKLLGHLSQKELADYFRKADIFVLPSYYEGLSLGTLEALACGLRAVVTDIKGMRNHLGVEINDTGVIQYINLPKMKSIDEPEEELPIGFMKDLEKAIELQILEVIRGNYEYLSLENRYREMSWEGIYDKLWDCITQYKDIR